MTTPAPRLAYVAQYYKVKRLDGSYWIEVTVDRKPYTEIGPFETVASRDAALDDVMEMVRSMGGKDAQCQ